MITQVSGGHLCRSRSLLRCGVGGGDMAGEVVPVPTRGRREDTLDNETNVPQLVAVGRRC